MTAGMIENELATNNHIVFHEHSTPVRIIGNDKPEENFLKLFCTKSNFIYFFMTTSTYSSWCVRKIDSGATDSITMTFFLFSTTSDISSAATTAFEATIFTCWRNMIICY